MEFCTSIKRSPINVPLPIRINSKTSGLSNSLSLPISHSLVQVYSRQRTRSLIAAVASNPASRSCKLKTAVAPLEPSSQEGMLLSCVFQSKRHLFRFAVSEQLHELASDRDEAAAHKMPSSDSMESLLYRRIAEMKEEERQTAVQDIMYMSIVDMFSEVQVPIVPELSECISNNNQEVWSAKCKELESIHSVEVQEMIREHLSMILLRMRGKSSLLDNSTTTKIDKLHLGRIYASSVMYGYFLKSACLQRKMDFNLAQTQDHLLPLGHNSCHCFTEVYPSEMWGLTFRQASNTQITSMCQESHRCENLGNYIKGFSSESLQRCAKLKSQEAVNVIEKHTWALFGDEKNGQVGHDREISITFSYMERLVLEAVAFGSFLWDVERSVDSIYTLNRK